MALNLLSLLKGQIWKFERKAKTVSAQNVPDWRRELRYFDSTSAIGLLISGRVVHLISR